jgi:hypothetical protein
MLKILQIKIKLFLLSKSLHCPQFYLFKFPLFIFLIYIFTFPYIISFFQIQFLKIFSHPFRHCILNHSIKHFIIFLIISLIFNLLLLIFKICEPIFLKHLDLFLPLLKHRFFPWIYNLINFVKWISLIFSRISMPFSFFFCLLQFILNPSFKQNIIILSNSFFFYLLVLQFLDFMVDIVNKILFIIIFFQIVQVFFCVVGLFGSIVSVEDFLFIFLVLRGLDGPERVCF